MWFLVGVYFGGCFGIGWFVGILKLFFWSFGGKEKDGGDYVW